MTNFTVSSCTGSGAPRRLGSFRDSIYNSEKLLEDGCRAVSGRTLCPLHSTHPIPATARGVRKEESSPGILLSMFCLLQSTLQTL